MRKPPMFFNQSDGITKTQKWRFPKKKKHRKKIGIKTKEVPFTPRVESLSYLLSTHLSVLLFSFLLGGLLRNGKKRLNVFLYVQQQIEFSSRIPVYKFNEKSLRYIDARKVIVRLLLVCLQSVPYSFLFFSSLLFSSLLFSSLLFSSLHSTPLHFYPFLHSRPPCLIS